jgi:hypothetical protein
VLITVVGVVWLGTARLKKISLTEARHEGLLLANTVEAAVLRDVARGDVAAVQHYIDTLVAMRDRNDLEINILLVHEEGSEIVASNVPDNIEGADEEEHADAVESIRSGRPEVEIEIEEGPEDEAEALLSRDPSHPDFYFPAGSRLLAITTPLTFQGEPLGCINLKLSLAGLPEDSELHENLDTVLSAARRAKDLVRQIRMFSQKQKRDRIPLQIAPIVQETLNLLRAAFPTNVEVRESLPAFEGVVKGDATHVHQIVLNLATNACQAMGAAGGRLDVRLEAVTLEGETSAGISGTLPGGRYLRLTIADTGPGMPKDVVERIFDPYFTTKSENGGTGLGLATVHGIVQDMGGAIAVDTCVGKGTAFHLYFPLADAAAAPSGQSGRTEGRDVQSVETGRGLEAGT